MAQHGQRTQDEVFIGEFKELIDNPETQKYWKRIVTFDPFGMTSLYPSIAATTALLNIPELSDIERDGEIVTADGAVKTIKAAVQYAWNIPHLAERLELTPEELREALFKHMRDPKIEGANVYFPTVGGFTCYTFGDPRKLRDPKTEITVRVHDECCGSDVFCTDICTCRPYLMFAMRAAVECAQRGGVGVVVYFKKEGRSLGEVTKYRVYNARKNQAGGDTAANYFHMTESIAGVRDARFQTMMPDVLHWLGISRIDWLLSMSNEKYQAIVDGEIRVIQRIPLPDNLVPKHADVEITAKIASGYHTEDMKSEEVLDELRDIRSIRRQCQRLYELGQRGELNHMVLHPENLDTAVQAVIDSIEEAYGGISDIPKHSRFRHFDQNLIDSLVEEWTAKTDRKEAVRRLIDLVTISVLLDAGAGPDWKYIDHDRNIFSRSEGLARATVDMFTDGIFSSDTAIPTRCNSHGLKNLTVHMLSVGFQASQNNVMNGLEGRAGLLQRLGEALENHAEYFGREVFRPGHLLDYILENADENKVVSVHVLWRAIMVGYESIWPERMSGVRRGDVWTHTLLKERGRPGSDFVPFHKLSQWLSLSVMEAFSYFGVEFTDIDDMTALAEYRNGGLFMDTNVLTLKFPEDQDRLFDAGSELVVEWRALTIMLVDEVRLKLQDHYGAELNLAQVLEGGTWRAGRVLAGQLRGGAPPLNLRLDGTVF